MSEGLRRPFVSVKFSPAGRTYSFLLPDLAFDADDPDAMAAPAAPAPGDPLVEYMLDGSRIIFYYTSESRVDFRELVRDLAAHFRTRIEMRQIGVRDEAKMLGGPRQLLESNRLRQLFDRRGLRLVRPPRIAVTVGDPAGIGPEIAVKAAADPPVLDVCEPVLYGPHTQHELKAFAPGVLSANAGRAAYEAIVAAVRDARSAAVDA